MSLDLKLIRKWLTPKFTIGELLVDGAFACFIGEDYYRPPPMPKVYGQTAIPCGTYEIRITYSPRFRRDLPLLIGVPGFSGVRIHAGNDAGDTEGCLLTGRVRAPDRVLESVKAFDALFTKMNAVKDPVTGHVGFITITVEPAP